MKIFCWGLGAQNQLVCSGCRNLLLYPVGATSVCCAVCNAVTAVPPPGRFLPFFQFLSGLYTPGYLIDFFPLLITSRHWNGPVGLWGLPHLAYVHPRRNKRSMFLLSHCQSSLGRYLIYQLIIFKWKLKLFIKYQWRLDTSSIVFMFFFFFWVNQITWQWASHLYCDSKSGCARKLWELQDAIDVPIWSAICEMCCLQFCDISRGEYIILYWSGNNLSSCHVRQKRHGSKCIVSERETIQNEVET